MENHSYIIYSHWLILLAKCYWVWWYKTSWKLEFFWTSYAASNAHWEKPKNLSVIKLSEKCKKNFKPNWWYPLGKFPLLLFYCISMSKNFKLFFTNGWIKGVWCNVLFYGQTFQFMLEIFLSHTHLTHNLLHMEWILAEMLGLALFGTVTSWDLRKCARPLWNVQFLCIIILKFVLI